MVQGVARALAVSEDVTSPTFVLMKQYDGVTPLVHIDLYRMERVQELLDLDFDELLDAPSIKVIEWGDMVQELLPPEHLEVRLTIGESDDRVIEFAPRGPGWEMRSEELANATQAWA
jgi:tRNA threonylcarbamoyladenosine biosynthesis protein TsaE